MSGPDAAPSSQTGAMLELEPDVLPDGTAITLGWERVHELTTEHGTRVVVDLRRDRLTCPRRTPTAWSTQTLAPASGRGSA